MVLGGPVLLSWRGGRFGAATVIAARDVSFGGWFSAFRLFSQFRGPVQQLPTWEPSLTVETAHDHAYSARF